MGLPLLTRVLYSGVLLFMSTQSDNFCGLDVVFRADSDKEYAGVLHK
jgi:hypothetical protein